MGDILHRYLHLLSRLLKSRQDQIFFKIREKEFEKIIKNLPDAENKNVLEIGCGSGYQAKKWNRVSGFFVTTDIDLSRLRWKVPYFVRCNGAFLPFKSANFDIVFSSNVLEHVKRREGMLIEMKRVLKKDGLIVIVVPSSIWKMFQIVMYYPFLLLNTFMMLTKLKKGKPKISLGFSPPVHGAYESTLDEYHSYSLNSWIDTLRGTGLQIHKVIKLPFCSPYWVWLGIFEWLGEKFDLCGSYAFICSK